MAIKVNGKDMKDAVITTDQYEMKILELIPDLMRVSIKDTRGESFSFVPRFMSIVYPEKTIGVKDTGILVVPSKETVTTAIQFQEKLRMEPFMTFDIIYARKKIATVSIE